MKENLKIYEVLQKHLDKMPVGFPRTKSGVELEILKHLFSPKEAKTALFLDIMPKSIDSIYRRAKQSDYTKEEVEDLLIKMVSKGSIHSFEKNGEKFYALAFLAIGMFEYQLNRLSEKFVKDFHRYVEEAYLGEFHKIKSQIRVIPVEKSLNPGTSVKTYNDVREIIKIYGEPIALSECICKKGKDLIGEPCQMTNLREICFAFRGGAEYYIKMGFARKISKSEALEIIEQAEEDSLILQTGNSQKPNFVCCCCSCCCGLLSHEKNLENPANVVYNNYYAEVDELSCTGCGLCQEICQMDAISIVQDKSKVSRKRCIGCGNCVSKCPSNAIHLSQKEKKIIPPKNTYDLYSELMSKNR